MATEYTYTTRRMMLMRERAYLITTLNEALEALNALTTGEIQSYNLGSWSISRKQPDLDKLQEWINKAHVRIDEITNILSGRAPRKISTCVYNNPQNVSWWRDI